MTAIQIGSSPTVGSTYCVPASTISERPVFAARPRMAHLDHAVMSMKAAVEPLRAEYVNQQITRMYAAAQRDPELAIGTAKELLETICKSILRERTGTCDDGLALPALVKATTKQLRLTPEEVPDTEAGAEI